MSGRVENTNTTCKPASGEPQNVNTAMKKTGNVAVENTVGVQPKAVGASASGTPRQIRKGMAEGGGY